MAAPHTSNWDFVITIAAFSLMRVPYRFAIKKEWMKFPFGLFMKPLGGIGIDRNPKPGAKRMKMVEAMAELYSQHQEMCLVVTPEGTRKKSTKWRTGFYYVAMQANVPIGLGFCDFKSREAGILGYINPSGDVDQDMRLIMQHYETAHPRHPELYSPDLRYI